MGVFFILQLSDLIILGATCTTHTDYIDINMLIV